MGPGICFPTRNPILVVMSYTAVHPTGPRAEATIDVACQTVENTCCDSPRDMGQELPTSLPAPYHPELGPGMDRHTDADQQKHRHKERRGYMSHTSKDRGPGPPGPQEASPSSERQPSHTQHHATDPHLSLRHVRNPSTPPTKHFNTASFSGMDKDMGRPRAHPAGVPRQLGPAWL